MKPKQRINRKGESEYVSRPWCGGKKPLVTAPTMKELRRRVAEVEAEYECRRLGINVALTRPEDVTFDTLADSMLAVYLGSERSKRSLRERLVATRKVMGKKNVRAITPEDFARFMAEVRTRGRRPRWGRRRRATSCTPPSASSTTACRWATSTPRRSRRRPRGPQRGPSSRSSPCRRSSRSPT